MPQPLAREGRPPLAELLREAGFRPQSAAGAAAVWVRDVKSGEKIEFITTHQGTALGHGGVVPLGQQPGMAAIPLVDLNVLADHTGVLALPPTRGMLAVEVRVPVLGAYVLNKALTFVRRGDAADDAGVPKMAKDLLYLADFVAAGRQVVAAIVADLDRIAQASPKNAERARSAATNLGFVVDGHLRGHATAAARMAVERESAGSMAAEEARLRGRLLDLQEILTDCADQHAPLDHTGVEGDADA